MLQDEDDFMATPTVLADGEGFRFKHGVERETTGMWMWSRPFVRTLPSGERVAVLLVDTQGTFDNKTTTKENASIFALNSLVSSQQVYNIKEKIQEDVLQHMHLFTSYGIMVKEQAEGAKPFQALEVQAGACTPAYAPAHPPMRPGARPCAPELAQLGTDPAEHPNLHAPPRVHHGLPRTPRSPPTRRTGCAARLIVSHPGLGV